MVAPSMSALRSARRGQRLRLNLAIGPLCRHMKNRSVISLLLSVVWCSASAQITHTVGQTNTTTLAPQTPAAATNSPGKLPTWYVFKIKAFHKVTHSGDRSSAIIEGVTIKDKEFKVKLVWDDSFNGNQQKILDAWRKRSKADFQAGIPYVIAGKIISRDPLAIKPDTMTPHAPNFGAPPENVY